MKYIRCHSLTCITGALSRNRYQCFYRGKAT